MGDRVPSTPWGPNLAPLTNEAFRRVHAAALDVVRAWGTPALDAALQRLHDSLREAGHSPEELGG
jgi:hypothetical protein